LHNAQHKCQNYDAFKRKKEAGEHDLRIATIFTYGANESTGEDGGKLPSEALDDEFSDQFDDQLGIAAEPTSAYGKVHSREKLEEYLGDYNKMFGQNYSTKDSKSFQDYYDNLSGRLKAREKVNFKDEDRLYIVLVVNMMLTGFDAKMLNTIYVDKNLKYHGLIQAFSRTNRIINEKKSQGNVVCFRNLKKATDEAITLFSNKDAIDTIVMAPFEDVTVKFDEALEELKKVTPTVESVDDLQGDQQRLGFVQAFRRLMRVKNVLSSYADFNWEDMDISEEEFTDYTNKYIDVKEFIGKDPTQKDSILNDIDFELELINRDEINVAYILKLLAGLKDEKDPIAAGKQKKSIVDLLVGDVSLRSERELIEKFIDENLPEIRDLDAISEEFDQYWSDQKVLALSKLCEEEKLDKDQFKALIETYVYTEQEPLRKDVFDCLDNRPSVLQARSIRERIITRMKEYVEVFINGMVEN
jgi:type I restriction enzyme R subunit